MLRAWCPELATAMETIGRPIVNMMRGRWRWWAWSSKCGSAAALGFAEKLVTVLAMAATASVACKSTSCVTGNADGMLATPVICVSVYFSFYLYANA